MDNVDLPGNDALLRGMSTFERHRKRNLAVNWAGLLASTAAAAAYAQHESATGRMVRWKRGYIPRGIVVGILVFLATYFVLWFAYHLATRDRHSKRRSVALYAASNTRK